MCHMYRVSFISPLQAYCWQEEAKAKEQDRARGSTERRRGRETPSPKRQVLAAGPDTATWPHGHRVSVVTVLTPGTMVKTTGPHRSATTGHLGGRQDPRGALHGSGFSIGGGGRWKKSAADPLRAGVGAMSNLFIEPAQGPWELPASVLMKSVLRRRAPRLRSLRQLVHGGRPFMTERQPCSSPPLPVTAKVNHSTRDVA